MRPLNEENIPHGYWERYWGDKTLCFKGFYYNDEQVGYEEDYWIGDDNLSRKIFYI